MAQKPGNPVNVLIFAVFSYSVKMDEVMGRFDCVHFSGLKQLIFPACINAIFFEAVQLRCFPRAIFNIFFVLRRCQKL